MSEHTTVMRAVQRVDACATSYRALAARMGEPTWELIGPPHAPVVLVLGGISAHRHVAASTTDGTPGWWDCIVGPGKSIDAARYRILGIDFLDGGRSANGGPSRVVTTRDQAMHIARAVQALGVGPLHAVVGASYGGMVALALAEARPRMLKRLIVVSAADSPHVMTTALRSIQRQIVELGLRTGEVAEAMTLARALAMTTYRTAREFDSRFDRTAQVHDGQLAFEVEHYLARAGRKFASRMSPERFLALSLSADLHRVTPESVSVPTTLIAAEGDTLVPPSQMLTMAARLPRLEGVHVLQTPFGHDAFLTEPEQLGALISPALDNLS